MTAPQKNTSPEVTAEATASNSPREATSRADRGGFLGSTNSEAGDHSPSGPATRGAVPSEPRTYFTPWGFLPVVDVIDTPPEVIEQEAQVAIRDRWEAHRQAAALRCDMQAVRRAQDRIDAATANLVRLAAELAVK